MLAATMIIDIKQHFCTGSLTTAWCLVWQCTTEAPSNNTERLSAATPQPSQNIKIQDCVQDKLAESIRSGNSPCHVILDQKQIYCKVYEIYQIESKYIAECGKYIAELFVLDDSHHRGLLPAIDIISRNKKMEIGFSCFQYSVNYFPVLFLQPVNCPLGQLWTNT